MRKHVLSNEFDERPIIGERSRTDSWNGGLTIGFLISAEPELPYAACKRVVGVTGDVNCFDNCCELVLVVTSSSMIGMSVHEPGVGHNLSLSVL